MNAMCQMQSLERVLTLYFLVPLNMFTPFWLFLAISS
jgi:hypothetical protein